MIDEATMAMLCECFGFQVESERFGSRTVHTGTIRVAGALFSSTIDTLNDPCASVAVEHLALSALATVRTLRIAVTSPEVEQAFGLKNNEPTPEKP